MTPRAVRLVGMVGPDRLIGLFTLILGVVIYATRPALSDTARNGDLGAGFVPTIVAALLILLSILHIVRSTPTKEDADRDSASGPIFLTVAFVLLTIGYVAAFEPLGFTLATTLYLMAALTVLGRKTLRAALFNGVYAFAATTVFGLVMTQLFSTSLPGTLFF